MLFSRRNVGWAALTSVTAAGIGSSAAGAADDKPHRLLIHVGGPDPVLMNTALANIEAAAGHYAEIGQSVAIELVANGPGYAMLRNDTSPVKTRIAAIRQQFPFVVFSACQRSRAAIAKMENKTPDQIVEVAEATDVAAGVVRIMELQEQGWSYVRT